MRRRGRPGTTSGRGPRGRARPNGSCPGRRAALPGSGWSNPPAVRAEVGGIGASLGRVEAFAVRPRSRPEEGLLRCRRTLSHCRRFRRRRPIPHLGSLW